MFIYIVIQMRKRLSYVSFSIKTKPSAQTLAYFFSGAGGGGGEGKTTRRLNKPLHENEFDLFDFHE